MAVTHLMTAEPDEHTAKTAFHAVATPFFNMSVSIQKKH